MCPSAGIAINDQVALPDKGVNGQRYVGKGSADPYEHVVVAIESAIEARLGAVIGVLWCNNLRLGRKVAPGPYVLDPPPHDSLVAFHRHWLSPERDRS